MQDATCKYCGASVVFSAKFCRQCGNRLDASEMTTRTLEAPGAEPPPFDHPTRPANAGITSPTYAPPSAAPLQPVIGNAPPASNKTALFVILGVVVALMIGLGVVAFLVFGTSSSRLVPPPPPPPGGEARERGGVPPPPPIPSVPAPVPPLPPDMPGDIPASPGNVKFPFDDSLMYPGAKMLMSVSSKGEKVAQLRTSDPLDKVADWYVQKLNVTEDVNMPGARILSTKDLKVIFHGNSSGTLITLTAGQE